MEKEIKVRKRRFAAFWATVLLVCSLAVPVVVNAADFTFEGDESDISVNYNDTISVSGSDPYTVIYYGYNSEGVEGILAEVPVAAEGSHTVRDYFGTEPEGKQFSGWMVSSVYVSGGTTGNVKIIAQFEDWDNTIREAGTYNLKAGVAYTLGNVTRVSGDPTTYISGSTFYVPADGTYTFN